MRYLYCLDRFRHHDMRHRPWPPTYDSRGHSAAQTRCMADHASVPCRVWIPPLFPPGTSCRSDHLPAASAQSGGRMLDLARAGGTRKTFRGQWSCLALLEGRTLTRARAPRWGFLKRRMGNLMRIGGDQFWCGSRTLPKAMCIVGLGVCAVCNDMRNMPLIASPTQVCNYSRKALDQTSHQNPKP